MATTVQHVTGLKELAEALDQLPKNIAKKRLRKPVSNAGALIRDEAKNLVPVRTGLTKANIVVASDNAAHHSPGYANYVVAVKHSGKDLPFYWSFVEFGTAKMAAEPFMRPAFESKKQAAVDLIINGIRQGVEEEAQALAK